MEQILAVGLLAFVLALVLSAVLIPQRRARAGYWIGLLPIFAFALWYLIPLLTCRSDNPVGCEWAGVGVVIVGGLALILWVVYSLLAWGMYSAYAASLAHPAGTLAGERGCLLALRTIALLLVFAAAGGLAAKGVHDLARTGMFVRWRSLGGVDLNPLPGERAVKIESYNLRSIQVLTNEGRLFQTDLALCSGPGLGGRWQNGGLRQMLGGNCWLYGHEGGLEMTPTVQDRCPVEFRLNDPPGPVVERVDIVSCLPAYRKQTAYALREDGSVWVWQHQAYRDDVLTLTPALAPGVLAGLVLGLLVNWRLGKRL